MMTLTDRLHARTGQTDGLALLRLMEFLFEHLTAVCGHAPEDAAAALWRDFTRSGRPDRPPGWLARHLPAEETGARLSQRAGTGGGKSVHNARQARRQPG